MEPVRSEEEKGGRSVTQDGIHSYQLNLSAGKLFVCNILCAFREKVNRKRKLGEVYPGHERCGLNRALWKMI